MTSVQAPADTLSPQSLRSAFGRFATGVAVITARAPDGSLVGLTVNSLTSLSLEPPLLLWCITCNTPSFEVFRDCSHYAVNILAAEQQDISNRFASPLPDKFAGLDYRLGLGDAPLLQGCIAQFECASQACYPGGDHMIMVGAIESVALGEGEPLLYYASRYAALK